MHGYTAVIAVTKDAFPLLTATINNKVAIIPVTPYNMLYVIPKQLTSTLKLLIYK